MIEKRYCLGCAEQFLVGDDQLCMSCLMVRDNQDRDPAETRLMVEYIQVGLLLACLVCLLRLIRVF